MACQKLGFLGCQQGTSERAHGKGVVVLDPVHAEDSFVERSRQELMWCGEALVSPQGKGLSGPQPRRPERADDKDPENDS